MKITILFDNSPPKIEGLKADWGFAALIEAPPDHRILFDTGCDGDILLHNMQQLGVDPKSINDVFISHMHSDHTGGLSAFLKQNKAVKLWLPSDQLKYYPVKDTTIVSKPTQMYDGIYSTGILENIEQSMAVKTSKGLVLIVGCSHPKMENILNTAAGFGDVFGIVGGLHSTQPKSLEGLGLICATHCTQRKSEIKHLYPEATIEGGAGSVIEVI